MDLIRDRGGGGGPSGPGAGRPLGPRPREGAGEAGADPMVHAGREVVSGLGQALKRVTYPQ